MKKVDELMDWCAGALQEFGDPSAVICQMFFEWRSDASRLRGGQLCCAVVAGKPTLWLGPIGALSIEISNGNHMLNPDGSIAAFGAEQISAGVWSLFPSLNVPGVVHGFVVLHGVPNPAPWERLILVPT